MPSAPTRTSPVSILPSASVMPWNDAGAAFVEQRVDAAVTSEPWLTKGNESAHGHLLVDSSSSPGLIVDTLGTAPEKLAARADDLKALYRAWVKAVEFQKANEKEADLMVVSLDVV
jgi:NitT/TauT family transport system substrate-binding protein